METETPPNCSTLQSATLCHNCQVLSFDDSDPQFELLEAETPPPGRGIPNNPPCNLPLDYSVWDSLPHLPILKESAQAGCDFCRLLRDTILSTEDATVLDNGVVDFLEENVHRYVEIRLEYWWGWSKPLDSGSRLGGIGCRSCPFRMMMLTVIIEAEFIDASDDESTDGPFELSFDFLLEGFEGE